MKVFRGSSRKLTIMSELCISMTGDLFPSTSYQISSVTLLTKPIERETEKRIVKILHKDVKFNFFYYFCIKKYLTRSIES